MRFLSNAHTHSTFCDGKNPPEEMIRAAEKLGFVSLGFSGHASQEKRGFWNEETQGDKRKHPYTENCDIVYPVKGGGQKPERLKGRLRFLYAGKGGGRRQ